MNPENNTTGGGNIVPALINPSNMMNGNGNDKKANNKNTKVTLDKNGKPKRKKASRGASGSRDHR
jgi:hypothetical protein